MKYLVLYSTRTGNTQMVAQAIQAALPGGTRSKNIRDGLPENLDSYDCVFMGFWVDKGTADDASKKVLPLLHNKHVALFATLGASPQSEHAKKALENGAALLPPGVKPVAMFICQGKVDPKVIAMMYKMFPADSLHGKNPESEARHKAASTHPDAQDLRNAVAFAQEVQMEAELDGKA